MANQNIVNELFSKVFVINLPTSTERWQQQQEHLQKEGIVAERFSATNGRMISEKERQTLVSPRCQALCSPGMIGCALSHMRLWRQILEEGLPNALILEDDVTFEPGYQRTLQKAWEQLPADWDLVYLGCAGLCHGATPYYRLTDLLPLLSMKVVYAAYLNHRASGFETPNLFIPEFATGTYAYAISRQGAQRLLAAVQQVDYHLDAQISSQAADHFAVYAVRPKCIYPNTESSTIHNAPFPAVLNRYLFTNIADSQRIRYSWYNNLVVAQIGSWPITTTTLSLFFLGILAAFQPWLLTVLLVLFIIELPGAQSSPYWRHLTLTFFGYVMGVLFLQAINK